MHRKILFGIVICTAFSALQLSAVVLEDFSDNHRVRLSDIRLKGNGRLRHESFSAITGLRAPGTMLVLDIKNGISKLHASGVLANPEFLAVSLEPDEVPDSFTLVVRLDENKLIGSVEFRDQAFMNLEVFKGLLEGRRVSRGEVYSPVFVQAALDDFSQHYQQQGQFFFQAEHSVQDGEEETLSLVIHIASIKSIHVKQIRMKGSTSVNLQSLIRHYFAFNEGDVVENQTVFADTFNILSRLGYFSDVLFRFIEVEENSYIVQVEVEQLVLSRLHFFNEAPVNIGLTVHMEYYNIAAFNQLDRFVANIGYEVKTENLIWNLRYTRPKIFRDFFFDAAFDRLTEITPSAAQGNGDIYDLMVARNNLGFTLGYDFTRHFSAYILFGISYIQKSHVFYEQETMAPIKESIDSFWQYNTQLLLGFNNLNDNFNPGRGVKLYGSYTPIFSADGMSHRFDVRAEAYYSNFRKLTFGVYSRFSYLITDDPLSTGLSAFRNIRLSVMQSSTEGISTAAWYFVHDIRYSLGSLLDGLFAVGFLEIGGMWPDIENITHTNLDYGAGIGLRYSPNEYSGAFFLDFPAGLYAGIRISQPEAGTEFTLMTHRDDYYYINLTVSF